MSDFIRKMIKIPVGKLNRICGVCNGSGKEKCFSCGGYGTFYSGETCYYCHGDGYITCNVCNGYGYYDDDDNN